MTDVSFADFVKQARERKKNEALAQAILGSRERKANGAGAIQNTRNNPQKPSLMSRMSSTSGVTKSRASSVKATARPEGNINAAKWKHDLHSMNNPQGPPPQNKQVPRAPASHIDRNTRTFNKFRSVLEDNAPPSESYGFNIKGVAAQPTTVIATNFASGTTAADIEAVMAPAATQIGGAVLSCRLISADPTVMVEMQLDRRDAAQGVVDTFNNQKADGRQLYVYIKEPPSNAPSGPSQRNGNGRAPQVPARASFEDVVEVDANSGARSGSFQDGRFGFNENTHREPPRGPRRRY